MLRILRHIAIALTLLLSSTPLGAQDVEPDFNDERRAPVGTTAEPVAFVPSLEYVEDSESTTIDDAELSLTSGSLIDSVVRAGTLGLNYCNNLTIQSGALRVALDLGETYNYGKATFTVDVSLKIEGIDSAGGVETVVITHDPIALSIDKDGPEQVFYTRYAGTNLANHDLVDVYRVTINSYTVTGATVQPDIRVTVSYDDEYAVDPLRPPMDEDEPVIYHGAKHVSFSENPVFFGWNVAGTCADRFPGYQLQILRLFNIEPSNNDDPVKLKAVVDWSQALTIEVAGKETPAQGMDVTLAEGTGWYIWRARPVGSIHPGGAGDARNWGVWTDAPEDGEIVEATNIYGTNGSFYDSCGFYFTQPDDTLNWVYSRALTEGDDGVGSRVAEAMTFMTPLGRAAQSQVRVAEDGTYMTANSTVDFQGRSTLSQMSAPAGNSSEGFFFRRNHFNVAADDPYSAEDFDDETNIDDPSPASQTTGSAAKYYNGATNEFGSQVPTVDGYPFARTILSTDGSSRPQEAGGIGKVFRIGGEGSNKERTSKIYYASASDKELIRLFGDEAPADSNVYKMLVTDPNKVTTVQWIAEGRVIATAYQTDMGDTIMVPLSHSSEPRLAGTILDTLRGNRSRGRNGSSAYKRYAFTEPTDVTVRYVLNPDTLRAYGDCFDTCATCDYRVRLYIHHLDEADSTEVIEYNLGADPCGTGSAIDTTMTLTLGPGTFAIERRLQTNTIDPATIDSLNPYGRTYAEQFRDLVGSTMSTEIYADDSLSTIITHLNNGNLDSLYLYLGLDLDSLANYDEYTVTTECCEVTFPILSPDCGFLRCPEDFDEMSSPWTDHLYDKWGATYGSSLYGYFRQDADWGDYEDSVWVWSGERSPHQNPFDAMVLNMITDTTAGGDPLYDCGTLWGIWTGLVAGIEQLRDHPDDPGDVEEFNPDFYLLDMFLKAAGWFPNDTASKPFDSTSGNGWLQRPYRYLPADVLNDDHGCKAKVGYNAGWHGDADSAHRWLELYECWKGQRRENKTDATKELGADCDLSHLYPGYPTTLVNWDSLSVAEKTDSCKAFNARKIESDCQTICEDRRQEFAWEIYRAYDTSSSPISFQSALCAVEAIVDSCVNECDLTIFGSDPIDSVGTPAQWGGIQRVFNSRVEVSVPVDDGEVDPYCANDSATLTEDRSVAYEDLIVEHLNYRLAIYWRSNGGTLWTGFMDALREVAPDSIVNRITDSTVWVPPYDYDVTPPRFEIDSLCDLHYIADTVLWSEMYPGLEHPLVNHLNEMLDDLWGYEIDTGAAYVEECESHVAETIARRYEYHLIESDRNALVDEYLDAAFAFYNGSPVPVPVDDELSFRKNFYAPADFADTNFWAFRRWDDQNFTFSHVELYECADKIEVTTGLHGPSKTICSSGVFTSFYAKRSVRVECGSTTLASSSGPSAATKLDRYMFVPYTESYGQFYVDSLDFLTYQQRHYTFFDSTAGVEVDTFDMSVVPKRIFGTRFFVDPSRQLSYNACGVKFCPDICWRWIDPPPLDTTGTDVEPIPCDETAARRIRSAIDRDVRECVDQEIFELSREYDEKCGDPSELDEEIIVEQPIDYIHFTLYYYDRVGNLVRTVPPKGVDVLPPNATRGSPTNHTFITEYDYDAEGRLVRTKSPDGGEARVWYDQLGRLRFSQEESKKKA